MKEILPLDKLTRLVNPGMVILVSSTYREKKNIVTCAWHMPVSKNPPLFAIALAKKHFSSELIRDSREFVINVPDWSLLSKVVLCGKNSGYKVDKFKLTQLTPQDCHKIKGVFIEEVKGYIECILRQEYEVGDHYIFIGEGVYGKVEKDVFNGEWWDTQKVDFIFHLGANIFFKSSSYHIAE